MRDFKMQKTTYRNAVSGNKLRAENIVSANYWAESGGRQVSNIIESDTHGSDRIFL